MPIQQFNGSTILQFYNLKSPKNLQPLVQTLGGPGMKKHMTGRLQVFDLMPVYMPVRDGVPVEFTVVAVALPPERKALF